MRILSVLTVAAISIALSPIAYAQEITLRAVSAFAENTEFSRNFERFIERVNKDGKGHVQINYIGGPRAIPSFEIGNAVRSGVIDIANSTGAYYASLMPESDSLKLFSKPMVAQRADGTWGYLNQIHNQKLNSWYLARQFHNVGFHIYLNKKIEKPNLQGLKIRVTPIYRDHVQALGGIAVTTPPGEVYTAMERGVVDGYGWPITGIFEFRLQKVTKYRIDPGFYSVDVNVLVNLDAWKRLNDSQRKVLNEAALWLEGLDAEKEADVRKETEQQAAAGIVPVTFSAEETKKFLATADEAAWEGIIKRVPDTGSKLRSMANR